MLVCNHLWNLSQLIRRVTFFVVSWIIFLARLFFGSVHSNSFFVDWYFSHSIARAFCALLPDAIVDEIFVSRNELLIGDPFTRDFYASFFCTADLKRRIIKYHTPIVKLLKCPIHRGIVYFDFFFYNRSFIRKQLLWIKGFFLKSSFL